MFYPDIVCRYICVLKDKSMWLEPEPTPGHPFDDSHLYWMLNELLYNKEQSTTKKHRWLGFIQGVMAVKGYIEVNEERDLTRPYFRGA